MAKRKKRLGLVVERVACDYGCGGLAYYRFANGRVCCGSNIAKCPAKRKLHSDYMDKVNNDPAFKEVKEKRIKGIRKSRTPEFKKKQKEIMVKWNVEHPEAGKEHSEWLIEYCKDSEVIKQMSVVMIKAHQEHPESFKEGQRKNTEKACRPEARKKAREKALQQFTVPGFKEWFCQLMRNLNEEHPEWGQKHTERMLEY